MSDELRVTSDERYETIWDIVAELRGLSKCGGLCFIPADGAKDYADRIEKAAAAADTNRMHLVNANEMLREECHEMAVEADRLADIVRRAVDFMERKHAVSDADRALLAEARKAIGEGGAE